MDYVERAITPALMERAAVYPAVFVTGPRQSGKSTLVRQAFPGYDYVSFEELDTRQFASDDPRGFLQQFSNRVILDEAQRVPNIFSYLQSHIDKEDLPGMYILSGSQNFLMLKSISQSLAGRVGVLSLLPFVLSELQVAGHKPASAEQWMLKGGYPRAILRNISATSFYQDYLQTYIQRDVRNETTVRDVARFRTFLVACAAKVGGLINMNDIGRDIGADARTVASWISILEESYVVFRLTPYYSDIGNRHTKTAKLYFYDTGLLCFLLGIRSEQALMKSKFSGRIFENAVIAEKQKQLLNAGQMPMMYFWRDNAAKDKEIDLLIETEHQRLELFEIKASMTANRSYLDTMLKFAQRSQADCSVNVIYKGQDLVSAADSPGEPGGELPGELPTGQPTRQPTRQPAGPNFINWQSM